MAGKAFTTILVQAALLFSTPLLGQTAGADLLKTLQDRYDEIHAAVLARNENLIKSIVSPEYQDIDTSGKTKSRDEWLTSIEKIDVSIEKAGGTTVTSVHQDGSTVFVKQNYNMRATRMIQGASHDVAIEATSSDTWSSGDKGLILMRSETDEISVKLDGTLVKHSVAHRT
ncbi:hypothetical protein [Labrys monachus]|uniref:Uncharacterized protein n=1 Tax=Labrys monachus TaxID=217067 RepID=A0ABU0FAY8_9HYPH|nr:hypothetical protein [Labrys monachus]MDQ0391781.1 hypothetical protein [Labrys monachus]